MRTPDYLDPETLQWAADYASAEARETRRAASRIASEELRAVASARALALETIATSYARRAKSIQRKHSAPMPGGDAA